jgi:hypothetical protein
VIAEHGCGFQNAAQVGAEAGRRRAVNDVVVDHDGHMKHVPDDDAVIDYSGAASQAADDDRVRGECAPSPGEDEVLLAVDQLGRRVKVTGNSAATSVWRSTFITWTPHSPGKPIFRLPRLVRVDDVPVALSDAIGGKGGVGTDLSCDREGGDADERSAALPRETVARPGIG